MLNHRMNIWNLAIRIIFLSQTTTGILGNFSLLLYYLVLYCREHTLKHTDFILTHLMSANALIILSAAVPQTMAVWGFKHFVNDFGCVFLLYIQGFARNVSIGATCLLSVFQAMTISSRKSCWKDHKAKTTKCIHCSVSLLWVFYMLIRFIFLMNIFMKMNSQNMTRNRDFGYCSTVGWDEIINSLYTALVMCPEFFFAVLITWSSASMIVTLYRHKQRVQQIHRSLSPRSSSVMRATQSILTLVSSFLFFHITSIVFTSYLSVFAGTGRWLSNAGVAMAACFPTFCPFLLIRHHTSLFRLCCTSSH